MKPKYKVGDIVIHRITGLRLEITEVFGDYYKIDKSKKEHATHHKYIDPYYRKPTKLELALK